jgi:hypothetical protein
VKERRKHERLKDRSRAEVTVLSAPNAHNIENRSFACFTGDVSEDGLRLSVPSPVPVGSKIELVVKSGRPRRHVWRAGHVVWMERDGAADSYSVGVRFISSPEQALEAWQEMLREKFASAEARAAH